MKAPDAHRRNVAALNRVEDIIAFAVINLSNIFGSEPFVGLSDCVKRLDPLRDGQCGCLHLREALHTAYFFKLFMDI